MYKVIKKNSNNPQFWVRITLACFSVLFLSTVIGNHYLFKTYAQEYANYNFAFRDYAHFRISKCTLYASWIKATFFQDHFSFALFYFVPFYWLLNWLTGSYTLLILQTILIVLSGFVLYKFVSNKTENQWLGLFSLLQYFLLQGRYSAFTGDVNIGIISACFIPFYLYSFDKRKFGWATIIFVLSLFLRENMALWFIFIAIVQMYWYRNDAKTDKTAAVYLFVSIIFFFLLFKIFIPLLETKEKQYSLFTFSALGKTPMEVLFFIIKHPIKTFELLFSNPTRDKIYDGVKLEFYLVYLISGGFLLFFRPLYFIWFIPAIALKMFNDSPIRWSIEWYYSIDVVTLLPISLALIIAELQSVLLKKKIILTVLGLTCFVTVYKSSGSRRKIGWWGANKECILNPKFFHTKKDIKKFYMYLRFIPENASLSASETLLPHLAQRDSIFYFPYNGGAQYLAFLEKKDNYMVTEEEYDKEVMKYLSSPEWKVLIHDSPIIILKKKN